MDKLVSFAAEQRLVCEKFGAAFVPVDGGSKLGFAIASQGKRPVYGIRHPPEKGTNGWYIWCGAKTDAPDFFQPLHAAHLIVRCPPAIRFLALAPGYGFISDGEFVDVWFDAGFLKD